MKTDHVTRNTLISLSVVLLAYLSRMIGMYGYQSVLAEYIRSILYIFLFTAWGLSVRFRIVHSQVRRCMTLIAGLMVFWILVRTMKYTLLSDPTAVRLSWYLYYFPLIFIPLLCLFAAMLRGESDDSRLPRPAMLLFISASLLLVMVLTNDFHQKVFVFPEGPGPWTSEVYSYSFGYWMVLAWTIGCALAALVMIFSKFRGKCSRRMKAFPLLFLFLLMAYSLFYYIRQPLVMFLLGDMTVVSCLLLTAFLESCIRFHMFPSNTGYDSLFRACTVAAQISDPSCSVLYRSATAPVLPGPVLRQAVSGPVQLDRDTLFRCSPIRGGYVFWQEDVSELAAVMERLEENRETLSERNYLARQNYEARRQINSLQEKNRLYDLLQKSTARQNNRLLSLLDAYEAAEDHDLRLRLLGQIAVLGAYVKRCGNLLFIQQQTESVPVSELSFAVEESLQSLRLLGAECAYSFPEERPLSTDTALRIYGFFEDAVETALDDLHSLWLHLRGTEDRVCVRLEIETGADLSVLAGSEVICAEEDGVWSLTLNIRTGGGQSS